MRVDSRGIRSRHFAISLSRTFCKYLAYARRFVSAPALLRTAAFESRVAQNTPPVRDDPDELAASATIGCFTAARRAAKLFASWHRINATREDDSLAKICCKK